MTTPFGARGSVPGGDGVASVVTPAVVRMYGLNDVRHVLRNPGRIGWELGWLYHRKLRNRTGRDIMAADWDNLVILDACRYDLFETVNTIDGDLSRVISRGSSTTEFLHRNFKRGDRTYEDTVYLSGNPQTRNHGIEDLFYRSVPAWESDWDEELRTVHPADLTERALGVHEQHDDKRLIVHYIQPHYPFIGETGREIEHRTVHGGGAISDADDVADSVWERLRNGAESEGRVWAAYRENLELALPHVERLVGELGGKSVVTSDHGNSFGRYGLYGHPSKRYVKELVEVPWLEVGSEERRTIVEGDLGTHSVATAAVEERLARLGYR